jgi:transposase
MKKILFIGIDFSKSKFDVSVMEEIEQKNYAQAIFENSEQGYCELLKWLSRQSKIKRESWLFCGEHTGLYSRGLADFLAKKKLFVWLENPLQIKRCSGIKRAKTDSIDACMIVRYACRCQDEAGACAQPDKALDALRLLSAHRSRPVRNKVLPEVSASEMRRVMKRDATARWVFESSMRDIERLKKEINAVEEKMHKTIMESVLKENYLLINSIKGVGVQTAIALLIHTNNFENFENARQLAAYCGCAPFPNKSGTIDKGTHISRLANAEIKVLLTQCAASAIQYNAELSAYFQRKVAEGKPKRLVLNNVRNKLIQRIFAVVTGKIPYRQDYLNPFAKSA